MIIVYIMTIVNNLAIIYNKSMISYAPFWVTLKQKGQSTYTLINKYGISSSTIDRLRRGKGISTAKIDDLCRILGSRGEDVIEYIDD